MFARLVCISYLKYKIKSLETCLYVFHNGYVNQMHIWLKRWWSKTIFYTYNIIGYLTSKSNWVLKVFDKYRADKSSDQSVKLFFFECLSMWRIDWTQEKSLLESFDKLTCPTYIQYFSKISISWSKKMKWIYSVLCFGFLLFLLYPPICNFIVSSIKAVDQKHYIYCFKNALFNDF